MGALSTAYIQADFFGKCIFLGLFILSFLCWSILIYKFYILNLVRRRSKSFIASIKKQKQSILSIKLQDIPNKIPFEVPTPFFDLFSCLQGKTLEILKKNHHFITSLKKPNLSVHLTRSDIELIETHLGMEISSQKHKLEKNLFILSMISTLAPFLGLLGTVWGILLTFSGLQSGGSMHSNAMILSGLSTALATTIFGLIIAIPAVIAYMSLKSSIKGFSKDMEDFSHQLLSTVEIQYRNVELS